MSLRENNGFIMRLERTINFGMFIGRLKLITTLHKYWQVKLYILSFVAPSNYVPV
jgi:hypothetical protein